jgi:hypothetical protein
MILQVEVSFAVAAPQEALLTSGCKGTAVINVSMTNEESIATEIYNCNNKTQKNFLVYSL